MTNQNRSYAELFKIFKENRTLENYIELLYSLCVIDTLYFPARAIVAESDMERLKKTDKERYRGNISAQRTCSDEG